jgi:spore germination cell wall hydrolase CwlJ-like protein
MLAYYIVEEGKFRGITEGATHYHATYVSPRWAKDLHLVGRVGAHIFYRWD